MKLYFEIILSCLLGASHVLSAEVSCTKSKNNGDILLYGNADWIGGWAEVYPSTGAGATFDLMFEMDCDACRVATCRTFDFELYDDTDTLVTAYSVVNQDIPYKHYLSDVIDHSIFDMASFGPIPEGEYTYRITSYVDSIVEASKNGTLTSLMDSESPTFTSAIAVTPSTTVAPGEVVTLTFDVADDAVLNYLTVNVNNEYNQRIGLKTQGNKVSPSAGVPRTIIVEYAIPSKGKVQPYVFNLVLCDLTGKCTQEDTTVDVDKDAGGGGGGVDDCGNTCSDCLQENCEVDENCNWIGKNVKACFDL